ncbi:hypothetical protein [Thermomonas sp. HDW16]|uniref:hypothetical protein n=1 Tax=Thermomonas sp. HDW16 TaxID=2714945 RepID=UPI0014080063|nr:hypothetical protein [Thermomonas sp. HDW16]QIL21183.1 hypothetical protein G7079_10835 [Thermomonas sp. HDW16]
MDTSNFLNELKRRQIYRGGVMYVVAGWVIVQVATTLFPIFNIPDWSIRLVVVALLVGFPLALVALWMFESSGSSAKKATTGEAVPAPQPHVERRRNGDRSGDTIAKMMENERLERQRANEELIAALDRLHNTQHGTPRDPSVIQAESPAQYAITPIQPPRRRPPRIGVIFIGIFALLLSAWVIWILIAPSASLAPMADSGKITHQYVMPAYKQVEQIGAALLEPLLHKIGVHIAPERVFNALMMLVALLVLRNLYRSMLRTRRVRRGYG